MPTEIRVEAGDRVGRLSEEISRYQKILLAVRNNPGREVRELCGHLKLSERSLFRYLEVDEGAIPLANILWDGQPLTVDRVAEYNRSMEHQVSRDISKSARLAKLTEVLNQTTPTGGLAIGALAEKLQVTERTVYRDLCTLETELGIGLVRPVEDSDSQGRYKLRYAYLPPLNPERALFIYLSLLQQKGTVLGLNLPDMKQALLGTLTKYRYGLKDIDLAKLEEKIFLVEEALVDPERSGRHLATIIEALGKDYPLKVRYYTAYRRTSSERTVEPYGLICKHHNWYLVGRNPDSGDIRTFRIDQIEGISPLKSKTFVWPGDFDLRAYCQDSWGVYRSGTAEEIRVRFSPEAAYRIRRVIYHPSQEIVEELPDGSIIVGYCIDGKVEFCSWLLQWQDKAEIIEPMEMREEMREIARRVAGIYEN